MNRNYLCFIVLMIIIAPLGFTAGCMENRINDIFSSTANEIGWQLDKMDVQDAWATSKGAEMVIAVLDTGVNFSHPELTHCQWVNTDEIANNSIDDDNNGYVDDTVGWDFVFDTNNPGPSYTNLDENNHATFIAGVIAAKEDSTGVVGIVPEAKIMNLKVWYDRTPDDDEEVWATYEDIGRAVTYAVDNGADVISISFSGKKKIFTKLTEIGYYDEMEAATDQGVVIVASAGNNDYSTKRYPACFDFVIGVGATDYYDNKASYSNYGNWIDFVAPAGDRDDNNDLHLINSTYFHNGSYRVSCGTSYSAPLVAGVATMIKAVDNSFGLKEVRKIIQRTCIDLGDSGKDTYFGYGMVNASAAIIEAKRVVTEGLPGYPILLTMFTIFIIGTIKLTKKRKELAL